MLDRLRKHLAIPLLIIALALIGGMFAKLYLSKDEGTFYLQDLYGDRSALEGVTISGDLRDGYHRTHFSIRGSQVVTATDFYEKNPGGFSHRHSVGAAKIIDGIQHEARPSLVGEYDFDITYQDRRNPKHMITGTGYVKTGLTFHDPNKSTNTDMIMDYTDTEMITGTNTNAGSGTTGAGSTNVSSRQYFFANDLNYGITRIGDKVYFTVPTTSGYTGMNGIYEITDFSVGGFLRPAEKAARELVAIDLDNNGKEGAPKVEVLGLEAVGDKLVLILSEDNKLTLRGFDSHSGAELGQVTLDIAFRDRENVKDPSDSKEETHYAAYEAFIDHDVQVINLIFSRGPAEPDEVKTTMLSFDLSDGVKWIDTVKESYSREEIDRFYDTTLISHRQGKLYVVKTLRDSEEKSQIPYDIARPKHLMIYVYENAKLVYKGELVTDMNDDVIHVRNLPPSTGGFGYDEVRYRNFDNVRIGQGESHD